MAGVRTNIQSEFSGCGVFSGCDECCDCVESGDVACCEVVIHLSFGGSESTIRGTRVGQTLAFSGEVLLLQIYRPEAWIGQVPRDSDERQ